ncbi:L-arabinose transport system permease protein AraQ [compost metagenome]
MQTGYAAQYKADALASIEAYRGTIGTTIAQHVKELTETIWFMVLFVQGPFVFAMFLAGYALARFEFPGSKLFSMSIISTQLIPGIMFLFPIYLMFLWIRNAFGLPMINTYWGMILVYTAFYTPISIWIMRGFFVSIPRDLEESAAIDGCTKFQAFYRIILPISLPGIIATGIFIFLTAWDELLFAWVLTTSSDVQTIPVGIRLFVGQYNSRYDLLMAASTVVTLPVMATFFMTQKYFISGMTAGAVKG